MKIDKLTLSIQVINITCPCGGVCVNEDGSYMIDSSTSVAVCEKCSKGYIIPTNAFLTVKKEIAQVAKG